LMACNFLLITVLLLLLTQSRARIHKRPLDIEQISVFDYPDEDSCDYDNYLWRIINNEVSGVVDYHKLLDANRNASSKEIQKLHKKALKSWKEWCGLCDVRDYYKVKGEDTLNVALKEVLNPSKKKSTEERKETVTTQIRSYFILWAMGGALLVTGVFFYFRFKHRIFNTNTNNVAKMQRDIRNQRLKHFDQKRRKH